MPIKIMWKDDTQNVLIFTFDARWTLTEFFEIAEKANDMMDTVRHTVHVMLDVRKSRSLPEGFMNGITNVARKANANTGIMVLVGINPLARTFISWYRKVYPRKPGDLTIYYAGDIDEAQMMIERLAAAEPSLLR
jgi:hypothetical protein